MFAGQHCRSRGQIKNFVLVVAPRADRDQLRREITMSLKWISQRLAQAPGVIGVSRFRTSAAPILSSMERKSCDKDEDGWRTCLGASAQVSLLTGQVTGDEGQG